MAEVSTIVSAIVEEHTQTKTDEKKMDIERAGNII